MKMNGIIWNAIHNLGELSTYEHIRYSNVQKKKN